MSTSEEQISMAIDTGEVLRIQYHGGSQPGAIREIAPKSLKNGKVRAYCYSSESTKSFLLNKIEVVSNEHEGKEPEWKPVTDKPPSYQSLQDFVDKEQDLLGNLGWYVDVKKNYLALHRPAKTGNKALLGLGKPPAMPVVPT